MAVVVSGSGGLGGGGEGGAPGGDCDSGNGAGGLLHLIMIIFFNLTTLTNPF